ncbi:MAG: sel1 repeat family protein, partial [Candidatus Obscuribacterales bacterium]|nr:sel1 repeat family protein [Candidatus Obscuribacterales bacterium]
AYRLHLKAAQKGDDYAQYNVGNALRTGVGVKRDSKAACRWYEAAVKNGNPHACNQLAIMYFSGTTDGVPKNAKEGVRLLVKGADMGCPFAQSNLSYHYEQGKYFKKDMKQAIYWYQKSADQDADNRVPCQIGELYEKEIGVPKDMTVAISYYERAAKLGNKSAKYRLQELQQNR